MRCRFMRDLDAVGGLRFYGPDGRRTGMATTNGNTTTFYDAQGRRAVSATRSGDTTTFTMRKAGAPVRNGRTDDDVVVRRRPSCRLRDA